MTSWTDLIYWLFSGTCSKLVGPLSLSFWEDSLKLTKGAISTDEINVQRKKKKGSSSLYKIKSNKSPEWSQYTNVKYYKATVATLTLGPKFQSKISLQIDHWVTVCKAKCLSLL